MHVGMVYKLPWKSSARSHVLHLQGSSARWVLLQKPSLTHGFSLLPWDVGVWVLFWHTEQLRHTAALRTDALAYGRDAGCWASLRAGRAEGSRPRVAGRGETLILLLAGSCWDPKATAAIWCHCHPPDRRAGCGACSRWGREEGQSLCI